MINANNYKDLTEDEMWELFDKIDLDTEVQQNDISNEEEKEETWEKEKTRRNTEK